MPKIFFFIKAILSFIYLFYFLGKDCILKNEQSEHKFIDLNILRCNDSSSVDLADRDNNSTSDFIFENRKKKEDNTQSSMLNVVASWDSSVHQSPYLNQMTPIDKNVYITVKINVKFKLISDLRQFAKSNKNEYIELVLRKRISVSVYLPTSVPKLMSLNRFKNLLNPVGISKKSTTISSVSNQTCVIYRIISAIPKLITEIENRESLAIKAASSAVEDLNQENIKNEMCLDNTASHFERYAKTIEAVDTILKRERIQQKLHLERLIQLSKNNGPLVQKEFEDDSPYKPHQKTFSVPNLIKNVILYCI